MILRTRHLRLDPVSAADINDLVLLDSDPEVMRYVSGGAPTPREEIVDWVVPRAESHLRSAKGGLWVARERRTGRFVGWVSLRHPRHSPRSELELSYRLARCWWGSGLATEASEVLISMAFRRLGTQRVFATTTAANIGSRRVMEKLGMCLTWVAVPEDDADADLADVEYELSRAQWEVGQAPTVRFRGISPGGISPGEIAPGGISPGGIAPDRSSHDRGVPDRRATPGRRTVTTPTPGPVHPGHRTQKAASGGRHRRAAATEFPFIATEAG